jgi:hypothetical protein
VPVNFFGGGFNVMVVPSRRLRADLRHQSDEVLCCPTSSASPVEVLHDRRLPRAPFLLRHADCFKAGAAVEQRTRRIWFSFVLSRASTSLARTAAEERPAGQHHTPGRVHRVSPHFRSFVTVAFFPSIERVADLSGSSRFVTAPARTSGPQRST